MYTGIYSIKVIFDKDQRLVVPLFQRPYVWRQEEQWEPLWEDIRNVAERHLHGETARPHFLGAVVLDQIKQPIGRVDSRLVIDGQQRLTTIQLFIEAFADICSGHGEERYHKALLKLTRNDNPLSDDEDEIYKIWPTNSDQAHFRRVMEAGGAEDLRHSYAGEAEFGRIAECYLFFHNELSGWLLAPQSDLTARVEVLYKTICEFLRMVVIELDRDDDAQLIFETLNARGTPLLPSDLVKNFLFHRAEIDHEDIDALYARYWKPLDDHGKYWRKEVGIGHNKRARIDLFLQQLLTLQLREEVPTGHIYTMYRRAALDNNATKASEHIRTIQHYAGVYERIGTMPRTDRLGLSLEWLEVMGVTTVYPLLLELFSRYATDHPEVAKTLRHIESYLVRRMVCQLSTRGYNKTFLELLRIATEGNGSISAKVYSTLSSYDAESNRWPRDSEFLQSWLDRPLYSILRRQRMNLLLESLERAMHTDFTELRDQQRKLTIEHVMPQEWHRNWPLPRGADAEVREYDRNRLIHTVGNLTLLTNKLNPSISNGDWGTKKGGIRDHSILMLNKQLCEYDQWDEAQIGIRGRELFKLGRKIWPAPAEKKSSVSEEVT